MSLHFESSRVSTWRKCVLIENIFDTTAFQKPSQCRNSPHKRINDSKGLSNLALLDLTAVFDTVYRDILIKRLNDTFRLNDPVLWLSSDSRDRSSYGLIGFNWELQGPKGPLKFHMGQFLSLFFAISIPILCIIKKYIKSFVCSWHTVILFIYFWWALSCRAAGKLHQW